MFVSNIIEPILFCAYWLFQWVEMNVFVRASNFLDVKMR